MAEYITIKVTPRQLWNLICAQNAQAVPGSAGWDRFLVGANMEADGVRPLSLPESDRLIRRLERRLP